MVDCVQVYRTNANGIVRERRGANQAGHFALTKPRPAAKFDTSAIKICAINSRGATFKSSRVEEREEVVDGSVERDRSPKLVQASSGRDELVAVAKSAGLSQVAQTSVC